MESEKYQDFKSLGEPKRLSKYAETITISQGLRINCSLGKKQFLLVRQTDFNKSPIMVILTETGKKTIWLGDNYLTIGNDNVSGPINSFIKNGVIISKTDLDEFDVYKVEFDDSIKLDFDDIPKILLKYFQLN